MTQPSRPSPRPLPAVRQNRSRFGVLRAIPGVARVASSTAVHAVEWSVGATRASASYVTQRAVDGEAPATIVQEAASELRRYVVQVLGINATEAAPAPMLAGGQLEPSTGADAELLRRGAALLRQSNDVNDAEATHPAFTRILSEITPDEARVLRYLYLEGPQPALDIRTYRPLGIGSELVASGLNMIAEHAGCRYPERVHPYLTNLSRLGLLDFSKEQVDNPSRYQVIEAQPKTADALKKAGRSPKLVQRSILLTDFGQQFVQACLPLGRHVIPERPAR